MSELINTRHGHKSVHWHLLTTVSVLSLGVQVLAPAGANAADEDHPTIWIELGGQLERIDGGEQIFQPPFTMAAPRPDYEKVSAASTQRPPRHSFGGQAKISFEPSGTDWKFSASVLYGRSNGKKHVNQGSSYVLSNPLRPQYPVSGYIYQHFDARHSEGHVIADFRAGRDVGLGLFGNNAQAIIGAGIRFAQFTSQSDVSLMSCPQYLRMKYVPALHVSFPLPAVRSFVAAAAASRSFHGMGPSVFWDESVLVAGAPSEAEVRFDWGLNGAVLFGRQKVRGDHRVTEHYRSNGMSSPILQTTPYAHPIPVNRSGSVIVPNAGAFAGLSMKFPNAKVSVGYRADFFFGAMDGGIDTRDNRDRMFYGPFATISIGLGG